MSNSTPPPSYLKAFRDQGAFEIGWPDGRVDRLTFRTLRGECPCAVCIDEITGARLLNLDTIPTDIQPVKLSYSGNYAVKIDWSDGHNTGIFTWDRLRGLGLRHSPPSGSSAS